MLTEDIAQNPTLFGKILRGEIPCNKVYEDDHVLAFHDIAPQAKVHVLVIPKPHIASLAALEENHADIMGKLMTAIPKVAKELGVLESGFRTIFNSGDNSGQEVPHIHAHILGGEPVGPLRIKS